MGGISRVARPQDVAKLRAEVKKRREEAQNDIARGKSELMTREKK